MTATLKLSENIVRFRKEKKITQEGLAEFIGVTKASVSKWETGQSLPDILILPQLAVYFDVTVDELLGYEPQLNRDQIKKLYAQLAADYAAEPFEEVTEKTRSLVHRYYSCYPFLTQVAVLWLNHFGLAEEQEQQKKLLEEGSALCSHIMENCREIAVCNDAVALKTLFDLNLGRSEEVIQQLEEITDPVHASHQMDMTLIQAYLAARNRKSAYSYTQITLYNHLLALVSAAALYLNLNTENKKIYEETVARTEGIISLFQMETLHPNVTAGFYYQCAVGYMAQKEKEKALKKLRAYVQMVLCVLEQGSLHGDDYFDCLDEWIERLDLGGMLPRNIQLVARSVIQTLEHPMFQELKNDKEYQSILKRLQEGVRRYE